MTTATNQVIQTIRDRIIEGYYPAGSRLQEAQTAADLSVSRTPIREAFRVLANDHLLVYSPNRGYIVRNVDLKDVLDAYDLGGMIDGMAARLIAERGLSDDERKRFEGLLAEGTRLLDGSGWGNEQHHAMFEIHREFHRMLLDLCGNIHLEAVTRQLREFPRLFDSRLRPESEFFLRAYPQSRWHDTMQNFTALVEALVRRESSRAEALAREQMYRDREIFRRGVEQEEVLPQAVTEAG